MSALTVAGGPPQGRLFAATLRSTGSEKSRPEKGPLTARRKAPSAAITFAALVLLTACAAPGPAKLATDSARAHTELAAAYYQSAQYATAAAEAQAALQADAGYAPAHNLHGLVLMATGQVAQAEVAFARAVALDPLDADARNNRAVLLCRTGRVDAAVREWDAATRIPYYATPAQSWRNAAACLAAAGRHDDAQAWLARAARHADLTADGGIATVVGPQSRTATRDAP